MAGEEGKEKVIEVDGVVDRLLPEGRARVVLADGRCIDAEISAKIKVRFTRIVAGGRVRVELSPIAAGKARIIECIQVE